MIRCLLIASLALLTVLCTGCQPDSAGADTSGPRSLRLTLRGDDGKTSTIVLQTNRRTRVSLSETFFMEGQTVKLAGSCTIVSVDSDSATVHVKAVMAAGRETIGGINTTLTARADKGTVLPLGEVATLSASL